MIWIIRDTIFNCGSLSALGHVSRGRPASFPHMTPDHLLKTAQAISAVGFLAYGIGCLTTRTMQTEFLRYGLPGLRVMTGVLQITAAIGLLAGYIYPVCALLSAAGLSVMMLVAIGVRLKIKDPPAGFLQALACFLLNAFVTNGYLTRLVGIGWNP